jgi:hypothetical protein
MVAQSSVDASLTSSDSVLRVGTVCELGGVAPDPEPPPPHAARVEATAAATVSLVAFEIMTWFSRKVVDSSPWLETGWSRHR